jgi:hypothetical protein
MYYRFHLSINDGKGSDKGNRPKRCVRHVVWALCMCFLNIYTCFLNIYTCFLNIYTCFLNIYTCFLLLITVLWVLLID